MPAIRVLTASLFLAGVAGASSACTPGGAGLAARDHVSIVGSSTVYPFSTVVAERFGRMTPYRTPKIEATGSGSGIRLFCDGVGVQYPDIVNSSRRIKPSELERCAARGVDAIIEVQIGFDGIVLATSRRAAVHDVSLREIYLALAAEVPAADGSARLVPNFHRRWRDIRDDLPDVAIEVLGPPPTSGTRDAFVELAMEAGCDAIPWIRAMRDTAPLQHRAVCHRLREDGAFIEAGENDNLIVQKLNANPHAVGLFGFSFLEQNADLVHAWHVGGVAPAIETISDRRYPVSRAMYFYVKAAHVEVIPGLAGFLEEFTRERAFGPQGYLADKGMIALPESLRVEMRRRVAGRQPMVVVDGRR